MSTEVRTEITDGVAVLTLSNPARRNAMNIDLSAKLVDAVEAAAADDEVGAIVVTGEEPAFCAGGDLAELAHGRPGHAAHASTPGSSPSPTCPLPTIAAVNGAAVGAGLNLALACDLRLAGPHREVRLPVPAARAAPRRRLHVDGAARPRPAGRRGDDAVRRVPSTRRRRQRIGLVHRVVDDVVGGGRGDGRPGRGGDRATWSSRRRRTMRLTAGMDGAGRRPSRSRCGRRPSRCARTQFQRSRLAALAGRRISRCHGRPDVSDERNAEL